MKNSDPFQTNYIGNEVNTPGVDPANSMWTGDVVSTVWEFTSEEWGKNAHIGLNDVFHMSGKWRRELTSKSADIRRISLGDNVVNVRYDGNAANDEGLRSYSLAMSYKARASGNSLLWDIEIANKTGHVLEIGELGFPLMVNDDYDELYIEHAKETKSEARSTILILAKLRSDRNSYTSRKFWSITSSPATVRMPWFRGRWEIPLISWFTRRWTQALNAFTKIVTPDSLPMPLAGKDPTSSRSTPGPARTCAAGAATLGSMGTLR